MTAPLSPPAASHGRRDGGGGRAGLPGAPPSTAPFRSVAANRGVPSGDDEAARAGSAVSQQPVSNPGPGGPPPAVAWLRADHVTWGDRMLRDGDLIKVLGVHGFDTPFGPVIRLQLADGSDWRGAPCDRIPVAVQR